MVHQARTQSEAQLNRVLGKEKILNDSDNIQQFILHTLLHPRRLC